MGRDPGAGGQGCTPAGWAGGPASLWGHLVVKQRKGNDGGGLAIVPSAGWAECSCLTPQGTLWIWPPPSA